MAWLVAVLVILLVGLVAARITLWLIGKRGHLMLPSTRAAMLERGGGGKRGSGGNRGSLFNSLHGYVYGRWPYQYIDFCINILLPQMKKPEVKRWWADHYHGKVLPTEDHSLKERNLGDLFLGQ